jgi:hypothetical protein
MEAFLRASFVKGQNVRMDGFFSIFDGDFQIKQTQWNEDFPCLFPELGAINKTISKKNPITPDRCNEAIDFIDKCFPKTKVSGNESCMSKKAKKVDDDDQVWCTRTWDKKS